MALAVSSSIVPGLAGSQLAGKRVQISTSRCAPARARTSVITSASGKTYTVKSGDYLISISNKNNVSLADLKEANAATLKGSDVLQPGQQLVIPPSPHAGGMGGIKTWLGGGLVVLLVAAAVLAKPKDE